MATESKRRGEQYATRKSLYSAIRSASQGIEQAEAARTELNRIDDVLRGANEEKIALTDDEMDVLVGELEHADILLQNARTSLSRAIGHAEGTA